MLLVIGEYMFEQRFGLGKLFRYASISLGDGLQTYHFMFVIGLCLQQVSGLL